jgi:KEOPS complex subunit Pcc1
MVGGDLEMQIKAVIHLDFSSETLLKAVLEALKPETEAMPSRRCRTRIQGEGKRLSLILEASDTSALRASLNSYLRWIQMMKAALASLELINSKVEH